MDKKQKKFVQIIKKIVEQEVRKQIKPLISEVHTILENFKNDEKQLLEQIQPQSREEKFRKKYTSQGTNENKQNGAAVFLQKLGIHVEDNYDELEKDVIEPNQSTQNLAKVNFKEKIQQMNEWKKQRDQAAEPIQIVQPENKQSQPQQQVPQDDKPADYMDFDQSVIPSKPMQIMPENSEVPEEQPTNTNSNEYDELFED